MPAEKAGAVDAALVQDADAPAPEPAEAHPHGTSSPAAWWGRRFTHKQHGEGTVVSHTLTGHTFHPETHQPVGGTAMWLLQFADGGERWFHEAELAELTAGAGGTA